MTSGVQGGLEFGRKWARVASFWEFPSPQDIPQNDHRRGGGVSM